MKEKKLLLGLMYITGAVLAAIKLIKHLLTHEQSDVSQYIFASAITLICAFSFFRQYKKDKDASHE